MLEYAAKRRRYKKETSSSLCFIVVVLITNENKQTPRNNVSGLSKTKVIFFPFAMIEIPPRRIITITPMSIPVIAILLGKSIRASSPRGNIPRKNMPKIIINMLSIDDSLMNTA